MLQLLRLGEHATIQGVSLGAPARDTWVVPQVATALSMLAQLARGGERPTD